MKKYLLITTLAFSFAYAEPNVQVKDERFSFDAAAAAFKKAEAPTAAELIGTWMQIGEGYARHLGGQSSYFPDGKQTQPGHSGYFYWFWLNKESGNDAFGSPILSTNLKYVGAETGKIYDDITVPGKLTATGYKFFAKDKPNSCIHEIECRLVKSISMLLCEDTSRDNSCTNNGLVAGYLGFTKQP